MREFYMKHKGEIPGLTFWKDKCSPEYRLMIEDIDAFSKWYREKYGTDIKPLIKEMLKEYRGKAVMVSFSYWLCNGKIHIFDFTVAESYSLKDAELLELVGKYLKLKPETYNRDI